MPTKSFPIRYTVLIQTSAPGAYLIFGFLGLAFIPRGCLFEAGRLSNFYPSVSATHFQ